VQLPTTLDTPESSGGSGTKITFERVIVHPDGHREIRGQTPNQLPAPAESNDQLICAWKNPREIPQATINKIKDL
jgi:hypothetical protein